MSLQFIVVLQDFYHCFWCSVSSTCLNVCFKMDGFSFLDALGNGSDGTFSVSSFKALIVCRVVCSWLHFLCDEDRWSTISKILLTRKFFRVLWNFAMQCCSSARLRIATVVCEREALWKKIHNWALGWLWLFFGSFLYNLQSEVKKPFELNSANVDLKHDAFKLMSEA